jgi:PIN domain nuclease of toxin-antitoxin system
MTVAHTTRLQALAPHHADPFDRMLVAQALTERATIVSHDRALAPYGAPMLWT